MLITPDSSHLGDKRLRGWEALRKSWEDTDRMLVKYRLDDQDELKNADKRMGKPMTHTQLFQMVRKLNSNIIMEDSIADPKNAGFYIIRNNQKEFVCAFEKGLLPEFSIVITDRADLPIKERRGWRTVLTRLLHRRCLTLPQILSVWGDVHGCNAKLWKLNTRGY